MSLINQALRKAQHDRTPNRMVGSGDAPDADPSYAPPVQEEKKLGLLIIIIGSFALLIGLVAGLTVIVLSNGTTEPPLAQSAPRQSIQPPAQVGAAAPIPALEPPLATRSPTVTADAPAKINVLEDLKAARQAAEAQAAKEAAIAAEAERAAAAAPSQAIIDWLTSADFTGVIEFGGAKKAFIDGASYEKDEIVNFPLGLKLLVIQSDRLLFEDANGKRYSKKLK